MRTLLSVALTTLTACTGVGAPSADPCPARKSEYGAELREVALAVPATMRLPAGYRRTSVTRVDSAVFEFWIDSASMKQSTAASDVGRLSATLSTTGSPSFERCARGEIDCVSANQHARCTERIGGHNVIIQSARFPGPWFSSRYVATASWELGNGTWLNLAARVTTAAEQQVLLAAFRTVRLAEVSTL